MNNLKICATKVIYTLVAVFTIYNTHFCQNTFVKIIDIENRPQYALQLLKAEDRYFITQFNSCGNLSYVCDGISEISENGEFIYGIEIPFMSHNLNSLQYDNLNNHLIYTGEKTQQLIRDKFVFYTIDPSNLAILDSFFISDSLLKFNNKIQLTASYYHDNLVISGNGIKVGGQGNQVVNYFLKPDYSVDTLLTFQFTRGNTNIWEQYVDHDGLLTFHFWYDNFDIYEFRSRIIKINKDKEVVWDWVSPPIQDAIKPYGFQHSEGFTVVCLPEWNHRSNVNLVAINQDGTTRWSHLFPEPKIYKKRYPARVKEMRNGDILVMGYYDERDYIPGIFQAPFMCRYSKDGKLLWERTYFTDYGASRVSTGLIFDMIEHEDGRIMAVGQIREGNVPPYTDILILTTDADGCITPGCGVLNKLNDLISETEEVKEEEFGVKVSPNPFHNSLLISSKKSDNKLVKLKVYNAAGVLLQEHQVQSSEININTDNWPSGLYFLEYWMENAFQGFTKVLRI
ncbi:MAG: T9SS type A sorting domain-containing protein [Saprospiraceae bacterium]|nr:T9SS type A sorting domain-containing protein [Saprospiraceae bacterium]